MSKLYRTTVWRRVLALVLVFIMALSILGGSGYTVFAEDLMSGASSSEGTEAVTQEDQTEEENVSEEVTFQEEAPDGTESEEGTEAIEGNGQAAPEQGADADISGEDSKEQGEGPAAEAEKPAAEAGDEDEAAKPTEPVDEGKPTEDEGGAEEDGKPAEATPVQLIKPTLVEKAGYDANNEAKIKPTEEELAEEAAKIPSLAELKGLTVTDPAEGEEEGEGEASAAEGEPSEEDLPEGEGLEEGEESADPIDVTVKIIGNKATVTFNGEEQFVTGYEVSIPEDIELTEDDIIGPAQDEAIAAGTEAGTYKMGLSADDFAVESEVYNVSFAVNDGELIIEAPAAQLKSAIFTADSIEEFFNFEKDHKGILGFFSHIFGLFRKESKSSNTPITTSISINGTLPEDVEIAAAPTTLSELPEPEDQAILAYDITLNSESWGDDYQPEDVVEVTITNEVIGQAREAKKQLVVYHEKDGEISYPQVVRVVDDSITFEAEGFSKYGVALRGASDTTWTVTFYNRDAEVYRTVEVVKGEAIGDALPAVIEREDYDAYWAIGEIVDGAQGSEISVTGSRIDETFTPTEDTVIVPDYEKITYKITFYQDENKTTVLTTKTVNVDTSYCLNDIPAVPLEQGYTGRWRYSEGHFNNLVTVSSDMDVWPEYAQNVFEVKFMVEGEEYLKDIYFVGDTLVLPTDPAVEGKKFAGWFVGATEYTGGEPVTSDLTITAQFDDLYSVEFVVLNDEGTIIQTPATYYRDNNEKVGTMPEDPFVAGKVFEKWVDQETDAEVTADTEVKGNMVVVAVFRSIDVYNITAEYYYLNSRNEEVVFNTDYLQVEAHEFPYTITAPSTTQTDPNEVSGGPIYYPETPTLTLEEDNFDNNACTVRFKYVPYTAVYDFVYMLKDLEGDSYTEIQGSRESNVQGVLNSYVTPTVKTFDYAVLELAQGAQITQAEGQELIVKYTRKSFQLTYESNGGSYVGGVTVPYGTEQAVTSTVPTRTGYTFAGWYTDEALTQEADSTVTINGNTTLYAKWTGDTVDYTIVYMFEKYNDAGTASSYVYDNSDEASGTVGTTVYASSAPTLNKKGWEPDTDENATSSVVITADGSAVLLVYYKLKTYTFTFDINGNSTNNRYRMTIKGTTYQDGNNNQTRYSFTAKLGQDISADWPNNGDSATIWDNNNSNKSYFYYWSCQGTSYASKILKVTEELLPNGSSTSITVTGGWRNNSTTIDVNYYLQNADDDGYTLSTLYSQTAPNGSYSPKGIAGYTYDHDDNVEEVTGYDWWGNPYTEVTEYNFYYNRHTYQIEYYHGTDKLKTISGVKYDATITSNTYNWTPTQAECGVETDYTWDGWYDNAACEGEPYVFSKMPAGATNGSVALVLYAKWNAPKYTVSFVDGDNPATQLASNQTVEKYKKASIPATPTKSGYIFDGWYTTESGTDLFDWNTQIIENTTVYAHWIRATLSYTVHYVDENENQVAPDKEVTNPNFTVGQSITEQAIAVAGYRPNVSSQTITLAADRNEITFVYSSKAETTSYTVRYILDPEEYPGNIAVAEEQTVENVPGDTASVIEMAAAVDYEALHAAHPEIDDDITFFPDAVEKTLVLSSNAESNVLTFYYSSYKNAVVTVHFVDINGEPIADDDEVRVKVGGTFTLSRTPVSGWQLLKAMEGTSFYGTTAVTTYKINDSNNLEFTLFYQKKVTITAVSNSKQYDGSALTMPEAINDQVIVEGLLGDHTLASIEFEYANADNTNHDGRLNAGTATVTPKNAEFSGVTNRENCDYYLVRYIKGTLEVTQINVTIRIEPDRWTGARYNGSEYKTGFTNPDKGVEDYVMISHEGYKAEYLDDVWDAVKDKATYDPSAVGLHYYGIAESDVGDYTYNVGLTLSDLQADPNYSVSLFVRPGRLQILPKEVTITTGSAEKTYDGESLTKTDGYTVTGIVDGETYGFAVTGSQTEVGSSENTYELTWAADGNEYTAKSGNYTVTENLGTLTVNASTLSVKVKDKELPYNGETQYGRAKTESGTIVVTGTGEEISTDDYTVTGLGKDDVLKINYTAANGKDAGTYSGSFGEYTILKNGQDVSGSYTIGDGAFEAGSLTIKPIDITVVLHGNTSSVNYDGEAHTITGYTVDSISNALYTEADFQLKSGKEAKASRTEAGKTMMELTGADFENTNENFANVTFEYTDGYQEIKPIDVTVTIVGNNNVANYDGSEHSVSGYKATADTDLYNVESDFRFSGTAEAARTDAGTTNMGLKPTNFTNTNENFATVTFLVTDGYQTINPIDVTVTIVGNNNTTDYDGEEHSVSGYTATTNNSLYKVSGETIDFTFSGTAEAARTDAGTTNMGLAAEQFTNTNTNFATVTFEVTDGYQTIEPIDVTVTITEHGDEVDYDGEEHTVEGYDVEISNALYTEGDFTFSGNASVSGTAAGSYDMELSADDFENTNDNFANVTFEIVDGQLVINPIGVTVTITEHSDEVDYDGEEHTVTGYDVEISDPLYTERDFTFNGNASVSGTDAGSYDMKLKATDFANTNDNFENVTFVIVDGQLVIDPISVTVTITEHGDEVDYDGEEHTVTGYDVEISNALYTEEDFTFSGNDSVSGTNAGSYDMELSAEDFANTNENFTDVTFEIVDGQLVIDPISVTVTITEHGDEVEYDGEEHTVSGYDIEIDNELYTETDFTFSGNDSVSGTNAGSYDMELSAEDFENTNENFADVTFEIVDGQLVISPVEQTVTVTITENSGSEKYDGTEKTATGYTVSISNPLYKEADFTFSGNATVKATDAGSYDMELKATDFTNTNTNFENVEFVIVDGKLVISKRTVTMTSADGEKVYDGEALVKNEQTDVTVSGDGFAEGEGATYSITGSQTEVGESKNTFTYTLNQGTKADNYTISTVEGTLKVTELTDKVTVTITENGSSEKYDGIEKTVTGYTVSIDNELYTEDDFTFSGNATVKGTDAGSYDMELKAADFTNTNKNFSNVEFKIVDGKLEISKRAVTLTSADDEKVYDGTALTNDEVTVGGDGFANGEGATYNVTGSQTEVGSSANAFTYTLDERTKADNYDITTKNGTLTVTALTDKVTVTITEHSGSEKYDGSEQTVTGYDVSIDNKLYTEADFTFKGDDTIKGTDAGSYEMKLSAEDFTNTSENFSNVEFVIVDGTLEISKRAVTLTSADDEKVYDGEPLTNDEVTVGGDGFAEGEGATYKVTGSQTEVGSSPNEFSYTLNMNTKAANYRFTETEGTLKVTALTEKVTVTITENGGSEKYDGTEKTVEGYAVSIDNELYTEEDFEFSGDATIKGTNAGTYDMALKPADFTNTNANFATVEFVIVDGQLAIAKRTVIMTSATDEKVYDGEALESDTVTVTGDGFVEGEGATYTVTGSQTEVGERENEFSYELNQGTLADNYDITTKNGTLTVTALTDKVTVTITENGGSEKYDGSEKTVTGYTVSIDNKLYTEEDFTFSGDATVKGTDAGSYDMELKAADFTNINKNFTNVEFKIVDGTLEIAQREVTLTSADDSKVYDGTALTNDEVTVSGDGFAEGEGATYDVTGTQTEVGSSTNTFDYTLNEGTKADNYKITKNQGVLEVTALTDKVTVTITEKSGSEKYDGSEKTVTGYDVDIDNELYTEKDFTFSGDATITGKDAGSYPMDLKPADFINTSKNFTNVEFKIVDGTLEIARRAVTLTSADDEKVYDGTALTNDEVTVGGDGFAEGEGATYNVTGSQTLVGESENTFKFTLNMNTKADNYNFTTKYGTLKVTDGTDPEDPEDPDNPIDPALVVSKADADKSGKKYELGETVTFDITATNIYAEAQTITLREIEGVTLAQSTFEKVGAGETVSTTATYTITEADVLKGSFTNTVTAAVGNLTKEASATVNTEAKEGHLSITKVTTSETPEDGYKLGDTITYKITVTNDGNLTITDIEVKDELTKDTWTIQSLAPGKSEEFTAAYTVTEADILAGKVVNTATATGTNPDPDEPEVPVTPGEDPEPTEDLNTTIKVEKTIANEPANGNAFVLGEEIQYKITVTNEGNVAYSNVVVEDELTGHTVEKQNALTLESLGVGESHTFEVAYTVTEEDILAGSVTNKAVAKADPIDDPKDPEDPQTPTGEDEITTGSEEPDGPTPPIDDKQAHMTVKKVTTSTTPEEGYALGDEITYKITVTNDGNLTIKDITVSDELTGDTWTIEKLTVGESRSFETSYTVTEEDILAGEVLNVATATGKDPQGDDPIVEPGEDPEPTVEKKGHLTIEKVTTSETPEDGYVLGDTISYKITAKNDGNLTLTNVVVSDELTGDEWTIESLAPNASEEFTATYTVTEADVAAGEVVNTATAKGDSPDPDEPDVPVTPGEDPEPIAKHYTVTYSDGQGNELAKFENLPEGSDTPTIENPTRANYRFTGWTPEVQPTIQAVDADEDGGIVYTATWRRIKRNDPEPDEPDPVDPTPDPTPDPDPTPGPDPVEPTPDPTPDPDPIVEPEPEIPDNPTPLAPIEIDDTDTPLAPYVPYVPAEPEEEIEDNETPEGTFTPNETEVAEITPIAPVEPATPAAGGGWALINLILTAVAAISAIFALTAKKDEDEDNEDEEKSKKGRIAKIGAAAVAVAAIVTFLLTEDMSQNMVMVDKWTLLMGLYAIGDGIFTYNARKGKDEEEEQANA